MQISRTDILAVILVLIVYSVNVVYSAAQASWYESLVKPPLTPPGWVFGVAWQTIYILLVIALARAFRVLHTYHTLEIALWVCNGISNMIWSFLFFSMHMVWLSLFDTSIILLTTWLLIWYMWHHDRVCSILLVPYGLWMIWAVYLNVYIAALN